MDKALVSVVMPVFNGAKFMHKAIDSVISQSYSNWELIIVDDNSADESYDVAQKYSQMDKRIVALRNSGEKHGASVARNIGIKVARGQYVTFLDCDDYYLKDALVDRVQCFEENDGISMVYGNAICDVGGVKHKWIYDDLDKCNKEKYLAQELALCQTSTIMAQKEAICSIGYMDERLKAWQDDDLAIGLAYRYGVMHCGKFISVIVKQNSIVTSNKNNTYQGLRIMISKFGREIIRYDGFKRLVLWRIRLLAAYFYAKEYNAKDGTLSKLLYRYLHEQIRDFCKPYFRHYFE